MKRISRQPVAFSRRSVKNQTVIPREVCEHLNLKLCGNPFATFFEWASEADEEAYADL